MTRKTLLTMAVLTAFSAGSVAAFAQTRADASARPARATLDANQDGFVDRSEAAAMPRLAERFDQIDADKDGRLSSAELPARGGKHGNRGGGGAGGMMSRLDTDKDGRISRAEAAAAPRFAPRFEQMDVNKDGYVDRADRQLRASERVDAWFKQADTDNNGQLSRAEYDAAQARRWQARGERGPGRAPAPAN